MRVLVACEESGVVRDAFRAQGHNAWSNDLEPSDDDRYHLQMDCEKAIKLGGWDLIIMHPPCDALAVSGNAWYGRGMRDHAERHKAFKWTMDLWYLATRYSKRVALENPASVIFPRLRKSAPVQYVQPHQFGHKEMKKTGFALHNLPELVPTDVLDVPEKNSREYIEWQKVWRMAPSPERKKMRSRTYTGIANAMAKQWGAL